MSWWRKKDKEQRAEDIEKRILSHAVGESVALSGREEAVMRTYMASLHDIKPAQLPTLWGVSYRGRIITQK